MRVNDQAGSWALPWRQGGWEALLQITLYEPVGQRVFKVKLRGDYQKKGELVLGKETHQRSRTLSLPPPCPHPWCPPTSNCPACVCCVPFLPENLLPTELLPCLANPSVITEHQTQVFLLVNLLCIQVINSSHL